MLVLVTYDVSTTDKEGVKRLNKVAKVCVSYGQRVQNSVFECIVDYSQFLLLKNALLEIIDKTDDSIRFYNLGNNYQSKIQHFGKENRVNQDSILIL